MENFGIFGDLTQDLGNIRGFVSDFWGFLIFRSWSPCALAKRAILAANSGSLRSCMFSEKPDINLILLHSAYVI